jgi:hypothetical protein
MLPGKRAGGAQAVSDFGRFAGLGLTFALTMALLGGAGWWLDGRLGTKPWLLVAGVVLGAIGGFVKIVRSVPPAQPFTPTRPPLPDDPPEDDGEPQDPRDEGARSR